VVPTFMAKPLNILLIEDNPADAELLRDVLAPGGHATLTRVSELAEGLKAARWGAFDAVLLDLTLPDSFGLQTISDAAAALPAMPIIIMTGLADESVALEAVRRGAQDYLLKGQTDQATVLRAIRYAIDRKQAEAALQKAHDELEHKVKVRTADLAGAVEDLQAEVRQRLAIEQILRMINECNEALVRAEDERQITQDICRIILDVGGYRMAWVGYAEDDQAKSVRPVASVGFEEGYLENAWITWSDTERGRGPTGSAIRLNRPCLGRNFLTDPDLAPWREGAIQRGFRSSIALPLAADGKAFGALTIYASQLEAFGEAQVKVLVELADDLAFGIMALRTRQALQDRSEQLRRLASQLTLAEHRERRRLAEVLHDHLQQLLVGAKFRLTALEQAPDKAVRQAAAEMGDLIDQSIKVSRSLTGELSPPVLHEGELVPALEWLALWMQEKHGLTVELRAGENAAPDTEDMTILLFQSVRELLFNVAKHAKAKVACVEVTRCGDQIQVVVSDQGAGFDAERLRIKGGASGGFGLFSIRERLALLGGQLEIASAPGRGSRFVLRAPLQRAAPQAPPAAAPPAGGSAGTTKAENLPHPSRPRRAPRKKS